MYYYTYGINTYDFTPGELLDRISSKKRKLLIIIALGYNYV